MDLRENRTEIHSNESVFLFDSLVSMCYTFCRVTIQLAYPAGTSI